MCVFEALSARAIVHRACNSQGVCTHVCACMRFTMTFDFVDRHCVPSYMKCDCFCRGGQPENTLEAIRRSKAWGAVAVEVGLSSYSCRITWLQGLVLAEIAWVLYTLYSDLEQLE